MKEETTRPEANPFDAKVSLIFGIACLVLAFLLCSNGVVAQTVYPAITKETATKGLFLDASSSSVTIGYPEPQPKKDTILVDVLCVEYQRHCEDCALTSDGVVKRQYKIQERTLEWQTWPENNLPLLSFSTKSDWQVIKTRWLESVEGCYKLTPLTNE